MVRGRKRTCKEDQCPVEFLGDGKIIDLDRYCLLYVGTTVDNVNKLRELGEKYFMPEKEPGIPSEDDRTLGRLSGFPETAIEAFIQGSTLPRKELPEEIRNEDFMLLGQFVFSKDNWQNEIETVRRRYRLLQQHTPELLEEFIRKGGIRD